MAVIVGLVVGPPLLVAGLLLAGVVDPGAPSASLAERVAEPLDRQTVTVGVLVAGAVLWLGVVAVVVAAVAQRARRPWRWLRRLPLPTPIQATVGALAGAAAVHTAAGSAPPTPVAVVADTGPGQPAGGQSPGQAAPAPVLERPGTVLADGSWLPPQLADLVQMAAAAVWWRRRRDYRPRPPAAGDRRDPDLSPLPPSVTAVVATHADVPPTSGLAGPGAPLVHPRHWPSAGVGLTGDGAGPALRGALVTLLLAPAGRPAPAVIVVESDLVELLGRPPPPVAGLHVFGDIETATGWLLRQEGRETGAGSPPVLVARAPSDPTGQRQLADVLRATGAIAVLAGPWPRGDTWRIPADGHLPSGGRRLCVLTRAAAADLLTLAATARRSTEPADAEPLAHPLPAARPAAPPAIAPRLELRVLGPPTLRHDGRPVAIRRSAAWQLLVFLAAHPAGATTHQLVSAFWPQLLPHTITGRLYTTVSELRRDLAAVGAPALVERDGDHYRLDPEVAAVDLWQLRQLADAAAVTPGPDARWAALHRVVAAYIGELAAGQRWPWLDPPREQVRRQVIDAYTALAADAPPDEVLDLYRAALQVEPLNADLHRRAADTLTAAGDPAGAAALLDRYRRRLAEHRLLEPDALTP